MKLGTIKDKIEFVKSVLPKKETFDTRYNFNYIKIEPENDSMFIYATDGFKMSTVKMPNVFELNETLFIHKNEPVEYDYDSQVRTEIHNPDTKYVIAYPDTKYVYDMTFKKPIKAEFEVSYNLVELLKELKYHNHNYDNPVLMFTFNNDGVILTNLKIKNFRFNANIQVLKQTDIAVQSYLNSLKEPFVFSINAQFLLQSIEKYFKARLNFKCRIIENMFIIQAEDYKTIYHDIIMGTEI